jgi:predicted PolB exonuclease-like 3'-5' exonuclease
MILTFDIETLPTTDQFVIDKIAKSIRPPGNIKKKESIDAWMLENFESALKEKVKETALNGAYGQIACIAWNCNDVTSSTLLESAEFSCIRSFYDFIEQSDAFINLFCGHNIMFDLTFLKQRSMILGIKPPRSILKAMNAKPWDDCIADTMTMWTGERNKFISLDELCNILRIPNHKGDFNGAMVADTWKTDPQQVIDYCMNDVKATMEAYKTMTFAPAVF